MTGREKILRGGLEKIRDNLDPWDKKFLTRDGVLEIIRKVIEQANNEEVELTGMELLEASHEIAIDPTKKDAPVDDTEFLDRITSYLNLTSEDRISLKVCDVMRMQSLARNWVKCESSKKETEE